MSNTTRANQHLTLKSMISVSLVFSCNPIVNVGLLNTGLLSFWSRRETIRGTVVERGVVALSSATRVSR